MHVLLIFLDGIGLGDDDPTNNPFAVASMPTLLGLSNGQRWLRGIGEQISARAVFKPLDPRMGVPGRPQSATGQAAILTGRNIPQLIGEHYGPRPNPPIRALLHEDNLFKQVVAAGKKAALLEGYPPGFHSAIGRGKRLPSSYQQALLEAGLPLFDAAMVERGDALTVDWTGESWRSELGFKDAPLYTPFDAGVKMVELSRRYDFAFFSHWLTDVFGHRGPFDLAVKVLELFDQVMAGALSVWDDAEGLMIVTSDHGNMEDLSHGKHTENDVPTLIIGTGKQAFADGLTDLAGLAPRIARVLELPCA